MELRQLRYFVKVAECQSFSEASRQLHITQSTLSQQTRQLEDELGVQLFSRDSHHVELTDVGSAFLPSALRALAEVEACVDSISEVTHMVRGTINIGATYTFSPILKEAILSFIKAFPQVRLNVVSQSMSDLMEMLIKHELDVVLSYKPSQHYAQIESHYLFDNELCVVVSDTHPLAGHKSVELADLTLHRMALPAPGLQARNKFDTLIHGTQYDFNVCLEINDVNALISLVRDSRLVTVLSTATVSQVEGVATVPIVGVDSSEMEGCYHFLRGSYRKVATREFLRILSESKSYGMAKMNVE